MTSMEVIDQETEKIFTKYFGDKTILIADPSAVSRTSIAKILSSVGMKTTQLKLVSTFEEAETEIERSHPSVVICDYDLGRKCGLDLLQKQRQYHPELKESLFLLVTGNSSQTAVAKAAEEDIDTYILKPITADILKQQLLRAVMVKFEPPEYLRTVNEGKKALAEGGFDTAVELFEKATHMDPAPSLACFYLGQAHLLKQSVEIAETDYQKGIVFNRIHYKCMVGLYEIFTSQKRHQDAYDVIKKISQYFPANPQRMTAVLRLAIVTRSYDDIDKYYQIFTNIDDRNEDMIKYICAALVVCAKHYLNQNFTERAFELFQKAGVSAAGRTRILREIVLALADYKHVDEAEKYLQKFSQESRSTTDYIAADLALAEHREAATRKKAAS